MNYSAGSGFLFSYPPRWVPLLVRLRLWFGGLLNQIGWALLGMGTIFCWGLDIPPLMYHLVAFRGPVATAEATILQAERTGAKENRTEIWKYKFQFSVDGVPYECVSYETGNTLHAGAHVKAEYPIYNPQLARIHGTRSTLFGWPVLFLLLLPIVGLLIVIFGGRAGRRASKLLAQGMQTTGKLISREPTSARVNNKTVYKLTFAFKTEDRETHEVTVQTHDVEALQDDGEEPLLYHPRDPRIATLLDHLPGRPQVDEMGEICIQQPWRAILCLILPVLTIGGNFAYVYLKYLN